MIHIGTGTCLGCHKPRTVIHTDWKGYGGKLETPTCQHCGQSWVGYGLLRDMDGVEGLLATWDEELA